MAAPALLAGAAAAAASVGGKAICVVFWSIRSSADVMAFQTRLTVEQMLDFSSGPCETHPFPNRCPHLPDITKTLLMVPEGYMMVLLGALKLRSLSAHTQPVGRDV